MSEAEFCCDEGQYLADRDQYEREKKAGSDNLLRACHKRIENQREEIRRLHNHIRSLEQSRNAWEGKAKKLAKETSEAYSLGRIGGVRTMAELLNAQIDEITTSRIELRAFPFAALLAERMKVILADTAKKVEEGSV